MTSSSSSDVVKLDVGGQVFSTTLQTLLQDPESMLARMFAEDWRRQPDKTEPVFIDRDGRHFHYILNYLRDGDKTPLPDDRQILSELFNEAEYFQVHGLLGAISLKLGTNFCQLKTGTVVKWRKDAIDAYWKPFALTMIHGIREAFFYDKVGKKYNDKETLAMCIGCRHSLSLSTVTVFDFTLRYEEWEGLKHHMKFMQGQVTELINNSCCVVAWSNGSHMHLPTTSVLPVDVSQQCVYNKI